jgi:DNA-directed RNA polymerase subunit RPC12/RpoP
MSVLRDMSHVLSSAFGCRHDRLSRLFTIQDESYMVCLACGHRVFYSVETMRPLGRRELNRLRAMRREQELAVEAAETIQTGPTLAA